MLPKKYRLPGSRKLTNAQSISFPFFTVLIAPSTFPYSRFGFVVSKKVDSKAVVRNRLKRMLRQRVQDELSTFAINKDFLFLVKKNFSEEPAATITQNIQAVAQKSLTL